jgi:hypothetical protein
VVNKESGDDISSEGESDKVIKGPEKLCGWIDKSDVIITLDLPEEYAHFNNRTIFPSYETGFMFRDARGEIARSVKLARKQCGYRVGFSKAELNEIHGKFFPVIYKGSSQFLTYEGEPEFISLQADGLPQQGKEIILKVTGESDSAGHYNSFFD